MNYYEFFVDGVLKRRGTKSEIYERSNKENCLSIRDFDEADRLGQFSYHCAGHCILVSFSKEE